VEARCAGEVVVIMHVGGQVVVEDWVSATAPNRAKQSGPLAEDRRCHLCRIPRARDRKRLGGHSLGRCESVGQGGSILHAASDS
jgi:hypothetical protein